MSASLPSRRAEPGDRCLQWRAGLLCMGVVTLFSLLSWRLIHLQCHQHEHFRAQLEKNHHRTEELNASRGDILDTAGRMLARDEPVQQVTFDLGEMNLGGELARRLEHVEGMSAHDLRHAFSLEHLQSRYLQHLGRVAAPALGLTAEEFEKRVRTRMAARSTGEVMLCRDLGISAALKLRADLEAEKLGTYRTNRGKLGALVFSNAFARRYADLPLKHIVGFFGETKPGPGQEPKPPRGVAGVERFFDEELTGHPGMRELEVDGWGNEIPGFRGRVEPPRNGRSLRLSLDLGLQAAVEEEMDRTGSGEGEVYLGEVEAERVIVVLFDPATMGVRAIGCRDRQYGPDRPMLVNPVSELLYEPGSTIKIATVSAAISSGKVNSQSHISLGSGGVWDDSDVSRITDLHTASSLTVEEILIHSSNIGAYKLARMLGPRRFGEVLQDFGFCRLTGFESPSESRGSFADMRGMQVMTMQTLSRVSFGMAIQVTPAQMCGALGTIINDGLHRPLHLAEAWVDENGREMEPVPRGEPRRVITPQAARAVRHAMLEVVERGTGKLGRSGYFQIAGKTGTARKVETFTDKNGRKRSVYGSKHIVSFIGFVPADKPVLGGLIIIDEPKGTKHPVAGGRMAAPFFRRVAERAMAYYQIPPQFQPATNLLPQSARSTPVKGSGRSIVR